MFPPVAPYADAQGLPVFAAPDPSSVYPAYLTEPRNSNQVPKELKQLRKGESPPIFMTVARDDSFARGMLNFLLVARQADVMTSAAEAGKLLGRRLKEGHDRTKVAMAVQEKMTTLREDGIEKVLGGMTTLEEVLRVTQG